MTIVKVCGVTLADDAARIAAAGADYIGLNFWPSSKRYLDPTRAHVVASSARAVGVASIVGVFVDAEEDELREVLRYVDLDILQLHGDEHPDDVARLSEELRKPVWKSVAIGAAHDLDHLDQWPVGALLLDTPTPGRGGSGKTFDWTLAAEARRRYPARRILLAGGLDPANVAAAIATVGPWGVDVASGVEAGPGVKDPAKVAAFIAAARAAQNR